VLEILKARRERAKDDAKFVFENRAGAGSIAHRGKKAASVLSRSLSFTFRAHDLWRTAATRMAEAGVTREQIARVLNHVQAGPAATRVYDRDTYDLEKRACARTMVQSAHGDYRKKPARSSRLQGSGSRKGPARPA
jgi:integrase